MTYEIEGAIKIVLDLQEFPSGFTKREFVITTDGDYPQDIKLECIKDKTAMLANLSPGDKVKAAFNIRGNEYNGNHYVNLQCWRLTAEKSDQQNDFMDPPHEEESSGASEVSGDFGNDEEKDDILPF